MKAAASKTHEVQSEKFSRMTSSLGIAPDMEIRNIRISAAAPIIPATAGLRADIMFPKREVVWYLL